MIGNKVNRGAGYGLEIPCKYHFVGSAPSIERLKNIVEKQRSDGLLASERSERDTLSRSSMENAIRIYIYIARCQVIVKFYRDLYF